MLLYLIGCTIPIQGQADFVFTEVFTGQCNTSSKRNLPDSTEQNILEQRLKELKIGRVEDRQSVNFREIFRLLETCSTNKLFPTHFPLL